MGTLGNTPEIQSTSSGREVLKYSIASNVKVRGESRVSWFKVSNFAIDGARREFFLSLPKGCVSSRSYLLFLSRGLSTDS